MKEKHRLHIWFSKKMPTVLLLRTMILFFSELRYVVRNLAVTGKRKLPGKNVYVDVEPEIIELEESLNALGINREQLIDIAICVGTDYNKGLEKVGPKTALKLIKKHGDIHTVLREKGVEIEACGQNKRIFYPSRQ